MLCPYCKKEMEEGYIPYNSPFVLKWCSKENKRKITVSDKLKWTQIMKIAGVFYCEDCGVFVKKI